MCLCVCVCVCVCMYLLDFFFPQLLVACKILVPGPGIKPAPPVLETLNLNQWPTREDSTTFFFNVASAIQAPFPAGCFLLNLFSGIYRRTGSSNHQFLSNSQLKVLQLPYWKRKKNNSEVAPPPPGPVHGALSKGRKSWF